MIAKRFVPILLVLVALPAATGRRACAQQPPSREYIIKAALLKHLGNPAYVRWPAEAIKGGVFHIGVLGNDPFGRDLIRRLEREVIELKNGSKRGIRVHLFSDPKIPIPPDQQLHLLFIPRAPEGTSTQRLAKARTLKGPILIVGDERGHAREERAMVSLYLEANRVRLEVNPALASDRGLTITPALISLAEVSQQSSQQPNGLASVRR
jgi:hypothetical protein